MISLALTRFLATYELTSGKPETIDGDCRTARDVMNRLGGATFEHGLYRIHTPTSSQTASRFVRDAFPHHEDQLECFGFDWLGRQFAISARHADDPDAEILMFEVGTGEVLEIPVPFRNFHGGELVDFCDAALAASYFAEWMSDSGPSVQFNQCAGYRIPLFLGGMDTVDNLELSDIDVYWSLTGHLLAVASHLPIGTPVGPVAIDPEP